MDSTIFNPLFWVMIIFVLYIVVPTRTWKKRLKYFGVFLFIILTNNWVSNTALHFLEYETIKAKDITQPYDIGILLGPFLDKDKHLPIRSESIRFTQAVELYKQNKFSKFLLSGNDNPELTRQHLISLCVPPEDVLIEDKSHSTYENALLSKDFINQRRDTSNRVLLITSAYHMRRAIKCFEKVGLQVVPFSVDYKTSGIGGWSIKLKKIIPDLKALGRWEIVLRECVSWVYFRFKNYI